MSINILKHESDVWKTADLLIGAGIKQSDFPKYMMPFFALLMVESRLIREAKRLEEAKSIVLKQDASLPVAKKVGGWCFMNALD
jgi:type I restriction enzyme M protein